MLAIASGAGLTRFARGPSPIGEREPGAERDKCAREDTAPPGQDLLPGDDVLPKRGGEAPVGDEDDEREHHENGAQLDHADERMRIAGTYELRQKGKEENGELRIQDVDQDGGDDHVYGRALGRLILNREGALLLQRCPGEYEKVGHTNILECLKRNGTRM